MINFMYRFFNLNYGVPDSDRTGIWMGLRAGINAMAKKQSLPCCEPELGIPVRNLLLLLLLLLALICTREA
jgi:hypothetical protein